MAEPVLAPVYVAGALGRRRRCRSPTPSPWTPAPTATPSSPGESIYYRVRLDFGQRAAFTVDAPAPGSRYSVTGVEAVYLETYAYAPDRAAIGAVRGMHSMLARGSQTAVMSQSTQTIAYRNRETGATLPEKDSTSFLQVRPQSVAGYYYFAVAVARDRLSGSLINTPVPVRVRGGGHRPAHRRPGLPGRHPGDRSAGQRRAGAARALCCSDVRCR